MFHKAQEPILIQVLRRPAANQPPPVPDQNSGSAENSPKNTPQNCPETKNCPEPNTNNDDKNGQRVDRLEDEEAPIKCDEDVKIGGDCVVTESTQTEVRFSV